jgi:hypothetical protein
VSSGVDNGVGAEKRDVIPWGQRAGVGLVWGEAREPIVPCSARLPVRRPLGAVALRKPE